MVMITWYILLLVCSNMLILKPLKDYSDNLSMFNKNKQKKSLTYHKVVKALEMLSRGMMFIYIPL